MQIEYQRDLKDHYLVLHGMQKLAADAYQVHMIRENSLRGFTVCHTELVDDEIRYAYRITSMQSLEETAELKPVGINLLQELFRSLADALEELELYLLRQDGILLNPSFIFTDAAQKKILFCYYPENQTEISAGMKELSEFLLPHLDERDRQAVMLGFSFYQSCAAGEMTETKLKELIYMNQEASAEGVSGVSRYSGFGAAAEAGEREEKSASSQHRSDSDEMSSEEIRAKILDDFYSDEEEAEAEHRQQTHRRLLWFLLGTVCALGTAAAFAVTGWVQTGIGAGVLIEAMVILLWRKRSVLAALKEKIRNRPRRRKADEAEQYENIDPYWRTYEERAETLERSGGYDLPLYVPSGADVQKSGADPVQETPTAAEPAGFSFERPSSGYEETIWLGGEEAGFPGMMIWLEPVGRDDAANNEGQKQGEGSSRILLTEKEHLMGKTAELCDITAPSAAVSRMHARFTRAEQGYEVTDLRSRNGTFINGVMLEAGNPCCLHDGDIARFADVSYRYRCVNERR